MHHSLVIRKNCLTMQSAQVLLLPSLRISRNWKMMTKNIKTFLTSGPICLRRTMSLDGILMIIEFSFSATKWVENLI